jgi:hypothetical protein
MRPLLLLACAAMSALLAVQPGGSALAQTLPLPETLVDARSPEGEALLVGSEAIRAYGPLSSAYVTQKTQSFCGVASLVMVLNALQVPAPSVPEYEPYRTFTQDNVLDERTETVLPRVTIEKQGITLDQLGGLVEAKSLQAVVRHASDAGIDQFRAEAREALSSTGRFVLVNYLRKAIGQERGGHISPLAAYDEQEDRFLILDVARYKYPPVWVKAADLHAAMNTPDGDNGNRSRGWVLVSRPTIN